MDSAGKSKETQLQLTNQQLELKELEQANKELELKYAELEQKQQEMMNLKSELEEKQTEMINLKSERSAFQTKCEESSVEVTKLRVSNEELQLKVEQNKDEENNLREKIEASENKLKEVEASHVNATNLQDNENEDAGKQIILMQNKLESIEIENKELNLKLDEARSNISDLEQFKQEKDRLSEDFKIIETSYEKLESDKKLQVQKLQEELEKAFNSFSVQQKETVAIREARSIDLNEMTSLRSQISVLQDSNSCKDSEIKSLEIDLKKALSRMSSNSVNCSMLSSVSSGPIDSSNISSLSSNLSKVKSERLSIFEQEEPKEDKNALLQDEIRSKEITINKLMEQLNLQKSNEEEEKKLPATPTELSEDDYFDEIFPKPKKRTALSTIKKVRESFKKYLFL